MRVKITIFLLLCGMIFTPAQSISAAPRADVTNDQVALDFPNTATFSATLTANATITSITLEYGTKQQTCGEVVAKAFPQFSPAKTAQVEWTWDMRQSGSLPPGATIWWRWRYVDESGAELVSEEKTATWLDSVHNWQTLSSGDLRLHYYDKDETFAQTMLDAGVEGLRRNKEQAGLTSDGAMDIYVYPNYDDMKEAILYEPSWTGGMAFSEYNIVIMGTSASNSTWDQNTVIHELTHLLVGHFTFSCIGSLPGWIVEGLAMFSEGELDSGMQSSLNSAIQNGNLITLRSLNGGFSELPDKANLSYAQSYSVINFMIQNYGQEKMTALLLALRDKPIDSALVEVYDFDTDGLDAAWRKSVGASPPSASAQPTAQATQIFVPTYVPVSGAPLAVTPTPYIIPTSSFNASNDKNPSSSNSRSDASFLTLTAALACFCVLLLLVLGVFILGFIVRSGNAKPKGGDNE